MRNEVRNPSIKGITYLMSTGTKQENDIRLMKKLYQILSKKSKKICSILKTFKRSQSQLLKMTVKLNRGNVKFKKPSVRDRNKLAVLSSKVKQLEILDDQLRNKVSDLTDTETRLFTKLRLLKPADKSAQQVCIFS